MPEAVAIYGKAPHAPVSELFLQLGLADAHAHTWNT